MIFDKMNKILLVDGHNLLFQMFFGIQNKIYLNEKEIHGAYGFIFALLKIIKKENITHVLVFFDSETSLIRKNDYSTYKENRNDYKKLPNNPFTQLDTIYDFLKKLNINYIISDYIEADDMINSYALKFDLDDNLIYILSSDTDFYQIVNNNIKIYRYKGENSYIIDKEYIKNKYNIYPDRYVEFKSMVGDSADNIKGIPKIGIKTASKIINENKFELIKDEYINIYNLNKKLISFKKINDLKYELDDLVIKINNNINIRNLLFKKEVV